MVHLDTTLSYAEVGRCIANGRDSVDELAPTTWVAHLENGIVVAAALRRNSSKRPIIALRIRGPGFCDDYQLTHPGSARWLKVLSALLGDVLC